MHPTYMKTQAALAVERMAETGATADAEALADVLNAAAKRDVYRAFCALQRDFPYTKYRLLRELERAGYRIAVCAQARSVVAGYCMLALRDCRDQRVLDALHCMLQVHEYACRRGECSSTLPD